MSSRISAIVAANECAAAAADYDGDDGADVGDSDAATSDWSNRPLRLLQPRRPVRRDAQRCDAFEWRPRRAAAAAADANADAGSAVNSVATDAAVVAVAVAASCQSSRSID